MDHQEFLFDRTVLLETEQNLPAAVRRRYLLLSCLKDTGDKQVYVIQDRSLGRKAVLKCASGIKAALLAKEAEFLKNHSFPFLPAFYASGEEENSCFLIREYIEGQTLEDYTERQGTLPVSEALSVLSAIAGSIEILHQQEPPVLHRDIKPQNFLLASDGRIVMLDVETVRTYQPDAAHDTMIIGTADLAAPEQFGYSQTSIQSDIYGLGMLLIYLLTGEYSRKKQSYAFLPHAVRRLIQKCIHFDPDRRYRNVRALKRDISSILRSRMRFFPFCAVCCTVLLLLCGAGSAFLYQRQIVERNSRSVAFENPVLEQAARQALNKSSSDLLTAKDLSGIHSLLLIGEDFYPDWNSYMDYYNLQWFEYDNRITPSDDFPLDDLRYFTGLKELALDVADITDLSPLTDLPLEKLSLRKSNITDISALSSLTSLKALYLSDNPLTDISVVTRLSSLEQLNIMNTAVTEIDLLAESRLQELNCIGTRVTDYSCIASMPDLRRLNISQANEADIALINTLTQLEILTLYDSRLSSLNEISGLKRLFSLDISACYPIDGLEAVSNFPNLDYLCISNTDITDLSPLTGLLKLSVLELSYAPVSDFSPLADCPKLHQFYVNRAMAEEISRQLPDHSYEFIIID